MQKDICHNKERLSKQYLNKMSEKILVPVLGESITEATVAKWLKDKGDSIEVDEPIVELETDKVNLEVPSPVNGVLETINAKNGEVVEVGAVLGLISENGVKLKMHEKVTPKLKNKVVNLVIDKQKDSPRIFDEENNSKKIEIGRASCRERVSCDV